MLRSSYYTRAQYFYEFHSIHGFGLVWKDKLFEGDMRSTEEVFTYAAFFFFVSLREVKIDTKTAAQETREEEVMHDD